VQLRIYTEWYLKIPSKLYKPLCECSLKAFLNIMSIVVSWLLLSLSQSPFSVRDSKPNFCPQSFATPWIWGYLSLCLQYGRHSSRKEDMHAKQLHKTRFYSITLLVIVALLTQTTQEIIPNFSVSQFGMVQI